MTDYKKLIIKMLKQIHSEKKLKKVYDYICFVVLKSGD